MTGTEPMKRKRTVADYPKLMKQWHPTKNGAIAADKVSVGSGKRCWWRVIRIREKPLPPISPSDVLAPRGVSVSDIKAVVNDLLEQIHRFDCIPSRSIERYSRRASLAGGREADKYIEQLLKKKLQVTDRV